MKNETYKKKLDSNGNPILINGEFVMELVSSETLPDTIQPPNWAGLTQSLWASPLFKKAVAFGNPNGYATMLKVLTDGENTTASENAFKIAFSLMGLSLTASELTELNTILSSNNFTISF